MGLGPTGPIGALWSPMWAHGAAAGMPKAVYACLPQRRMGLDGKLECVSLCACVCEKEK